MGVKIPGVFYTFERKRVKTRWSGGLLPQLLKKTSCLFASFGKKNFKTRVFLTCFCHSKTVCFYGVFGCVLNRVFLRWKCDFRVLFRQKQCVFTCVRSPRCQKACVLHCFGVRWPLFGCPFVVLSFVFHLGVLLMSFWSLAEKMRLPEPSTKIIKTKTKQTQKIKIK